MEAALNQLKQVLSQVCYTVTEFPGTELRRRAEPMMAVGIKSAVASAAADYLGETETGGEVNELYGLSIKSVFSLDIYAPGGSGGGATQCRSLFSSVLEALRTRLASGLKITKFTCGELYFDQSANMYRLPCALEADAFVYAVADESGQFVDFDLRGVTYNS